MPNAAPLPTEVHYPQPSLRSYYIDAAIDTLLEPRTDDPGDPALSLGKDEDSRRNKLYRGGLRIYTNYDPLMQYYANLAILNTIPQDQTQFTASLVSIDNFSGAVRAVAFGRGYDASQFNPAARQSMAWIAAMASRPVRTMRRRCSGVASSTMKPAWL